MSPTEYSLFLVEEQEQPISEHALLVLLTVEGAMTMKRDQTSFSAHPVSAWIPKFMLDTSTLGELKPVCE